MSRKQETGKLAGDLGEIIVSIDEINEMRHLISGNGINEPVSYLKNLNLDSLYDNSMTESEFLDIVESNGKSCRRSAGLYQKSLFSHYLQAKKENDEGYIKDVFDKALELRNNFEKIALLKQDSRFCAEWKKNFGRIRPETVLKRTGSMRLINTVANSF